MPQVFLSYSRKDQPFVRKLHAALESRGRDAWVDWSDIPPTTEFMDEIRSGIQASDTFIFVLSPDSVASRVCGEEIACALEFKKRLAPVVYRDVDAASVPPEIAAHNWLFFRDSDGFDAAFDELLKAIDTDLHLAQMHTRLLLRAQDWADRGKSNFLTLRGRDLDEAEQWLLASVGRHPVPTPLHIEYIKASRRFARARYRLQLYLSVAAVVVLILFLYLFGLFIRDDRMRSSILKTQASQSTSVMATLEGAQAQLTRNAAPLATLTPK
ncbi:MAG TPA: toll/interleukin-1 receptor domain-containing protein [Aggregatilineales bacterium]|nr:toll/interleukin-1 receptor domain-containing protein [Aggregatilineales bacterium]